MRWVVFWVFAYIALGLELGLREGLRLGPTTASPSFVLPLVVFIALHASTLHSLRAALLLGLIIDLTTLRGSEALLVIGPHALGYAFAAYFVATVRGIVIAKNPLTLIVLTVLGSVLANIVVVAIFTFRLFFHDPIPFPVMEQFRDRLVTSLLSALSAGAMAIILYPLISLFGFSDPHSRRPLGRR